MAYNPGIQDRSGEILAQGISSLGDSLQKGLQNYAQNKIIQSQAIGKFEGALKANPDLATFLNPEQPSPNAPSDAVKAFMKLQKDGTLGIRDAALLGAFADTYTKAKEDKQMGEYRAAQTQQAQFALQEAQQKKSEEDQMNAKLQQYAQMGQRLQTAQPAIPPMQAGPMAAGVGATLPNGGTNAAPAGPMSMGGMDAMGRPGNMAGGGVLRPEISQAAQDFMKTSAGQLAQQGVRLSPAQMVALQQGDATRMGAGERAALAAESRAQVQGLRNDLGAQVQAARTEAQAAKDEAKAATGAKKDSALSFEETKKLRDEFSAHPNTKNFDVVDNYYSRGQKLAKQGTAAGDMGLIFSLMKVYDPSSTVREGEYATASNSGSVPDQFLNIYNKAKDGQKLQPEQRQQFLDTMKEAAGVQHEKLMGTANQYTAIAKKRGLDPEEVIAPSYIKWGVDNAPTTAAPAAKPIQILSIKRVN